MEDIISVGTGYHHTLALTSEGKVYAWGYGYYGQIGINAYRSGNNGYNRETTPRVVKDSTGSGELSNIAAVSANYYHSMAMTADGTIWTWGRNDYGQLGTNDLNLRGLPAQVLRGVTEPGTTDTTHINNVWNIASGYQSMYAIREDGFVYAWGRNQYGQNGNNINTDTTGTSTIVSLNDQYEIDYVPVQVGEKESMTVDIDGASQTGGTSTITYDDGTTNDKLPVVVTIGANEQIQLTLNKLFKQYESGFNVKIYDEDYSYYYNSANDTVTFKSMDTSIVSVNATGLISAAGAAATVPKMGEAMVRITLTDGTSGKVFTGSVLVRIKRTDTHKAVPMVAAGNDYTIALREDGTVWAWGKNNKGQLGDGTTITRSYPVRVKKMVDISGVATEALLDNVAFVAAGSTASYAILTDGTVYAWGDNTYGELGAGAAVTETIAAGSSQKFAYSYYAQQVVYEDTFTYDAVNTSTITGVTKNAVSGAVYIAAGTNHAMALLEDGSVAAWGLNDHGQLGDGTTTNRNVAVKVVEVNGANELKDIVKISSRNSTSMALGKDGQVYEWGYNANGYLAVGYPTHYYNTSNNTDRQKPSRVVTADYLVDTEPSNRYFNKMVDIAAADSHSYALDADGNVWAWGSNADNNLGGASSGALRHPEKITISEPISHVYSMVDGGTAQTSAGKVYGWGKSSVGQSGSQLTGNVSTPKLVVKGASDAANTSSTDLSDIWYMANGDNHVVAFRGDGYIFTWGYNEYGQLGDSSFVNTYKPVFAGDRPSDLVHLYNVTTNNYTGYNGTETITGKTYNDPTYIRMAEGQKITIPISDIQRRHYYGFNLFYENDAITSTPSYLFFSSDETTAKVEVTGGNAVVTPVKDEDFHRGGNLTISYVDTASGATGAFALNIYGGEYTPNATVTGGRTKEVATPVVSAGHNHTVALKYDGYVYVWGANDYKQAGDGQSTVVNDGSPVINTPTIIERGEVYTSATDKTTEDLNKMVDVAAGQYHTLAVDSNGYVWAWGRNNKGQLGNPTDVDASTQSRGVPQRVRLSDTYNDYLGGPTDPVVYVTAGAEHSLALTASGHVYAWGDNSKNQLGCSSTVDGDFVDYPVRVTQGTSASGTFTDGSTDEHLSQIIQISAGDYYSAALKADGTVYVWGTNKYKVAGERSENSLQGDNDTRMAPYQIVKGDADSDDYYIQNISRISAGTDHMLMLTNKYYNYDSVSGKGVTNAYAIGRGYNYCLGNNSETNMDHPVLAAQPSILADTTGDQYNKTTTDDIIEVAAGIGQSMVLGVEYSHPYIDVKGNPYTSYLTSVWAWGNNDRGQIGVNSQTIVKAPEHVYNENYGDVENQEFDYFRNGITITAGGNSVAVDPEGYVFIWGDSRKAQMGDAKVDLTDPNTLLSTIPFQTGEPRFQSIQFKNAYVLHSDGSFTFYDVVPKHIDMLKTDKLYLDINQMYNRDYKGFTLLGDTEEYPVDRYKSDGAGGLTAIDPYESDGVTVDGDRSHDPLKGGDDYLEYTSSDPTVAKIVKDEKTSPDPGLVTSPVPYAFGTGSPTYYYVVVYPVTATTKFGQTVIQAHNIDTDVTHRFAGYTGAVTISIVPGDEITPMVSTKGNHALAVNRNGEVFAWGNNDHGQLGDGTKTNRQYPVQVMLDADTPLRDVTIVSAGLNHSVALTRDGKLYAWGDNTYGQLGTGKSSSQLSGSVYPVLVASNNNSTQYSSLSEYVYMTANQSVISDIIAGDNHTLAVSNFGDLFAWGRNNHGQLGNDSTNDTPYPIQVRGKGGGFIKEVILIGAGANHSLAVCTDSKVYAWGDNTYGQLGQGAKGANGTYLEQHVPEVVSAGEYDYNGEKSTLIMNVDNIAGGDNFTVVTTSDRKLYAWGDNSKGQIGNGTMATKTTIGTPVHVLDQAGDPMEHITLIAAGSNHAMAVSETHDVYAWGDTSKYQYNLPTGNDSDKASKLLNMYDLDAENDITLQAISKIVAGKNHTFVLMNNGYVWASGTNNVHQLGDMTEDDTNEFVRTGFKAENLLEFNSITITESTTNGSATISYTSSTTPAQIYMTDKETLTFSSPKATHLDSFNLRTIHSANAMLDQTSKLGMIKYYSSNPEIATVSATGVVSPVGGGRYGRVVITAYSENTLALSAVDANDTYTALREDPGTDNDPPTEGRTYLFVNETVINIGPESSTGTRRFMPVVGSGYDFTVALKPDGTVWTWGNNSKGQLGDNDSDTQNKAYPVQVVKQGDIQLTGIRKIAVGYQYTLALDENGVIYGWGINDKGQLGLGSTSAKVTYATPITTLSDGTTAPPKFSAIAAGTNSSAAVTEDGHLYTWGLYTTTQTTKSGVLGHGNNPNYNYVYAPMVVLKGDSASKTVSWLENNMTVFETEHGIIQYNADGTAKTTTANVTLYDDNKELENIIDVSIYGDEIAAIKSNGTLLTWGGDANQQSAGREAKLKSVPVRVVAAEGVTQVTGHAPLELTTTDYYTDKDYVSNVTAVSMASDFAVIIIGDGSNVAAIGSNANGKLGIGDDETTTPNKTVYTAVKANWRDASGTPDARAAEVATGLDHVLVRTYELKSGKYESRVWAWGDNTYGQLGQSKVVPSSTVTGSDEPVEVMKGNSYSEDDYMINLWGISTGGNNSAAIRHDTSTYSDVSTYAGHDNVWTWGDNANRQLGNMTFNRSFMPIQAGERETRRVIVLKVDKWTNPTGGASSVYKGTYEITLQYPADAHEDTTITDLTNLTMPQIDVAETEYLQVDTDKVYEVYVSGFVLDLENLDNKIKVNNATFKSSDTNVIVVTSPDTSGKLVPQTTGVYSTAIITVKNPATESEGVFSVRVISDKEHKGGEWTTSAAVSAGKNHTIVLKEDGTVWGWGDNKYGQLGDGEATASYRQVGGYIADDYNHYSLTYQGSGDLDYTAVPIRVKKGYDTATSSVIYLDNIVAIDANSDYNVAVDGDGEVYFWGEGVGHTAVRLATAITGFKTAVDALGDANDKIISVAAGDNHVLALTTKGWVFAWGYNGNGQLGDNTTTNKTAFDTVVQVKGIGAENYLYDVVQIDAMGDTSAALRGDGTVWTWGDNSKGQLGNGTMTEDKTTPVQVLKGDAPYAFTNGSDPHQNINENYYNYLQDVRQIAVGDGFMLALTQQEEVYAWGTDETGKFGMVDSASDPISSSVYPVKIDTSDIKTDSTATSPEKVTAVYAGRNLIGMQTVDTANNQHFFTAGTDATRVGRFGTGATDSTDNKPVTESAFDYVQSDIKYETTDVNKTDVPYTGVRLAALGDRHSALINQYGYVWSWGANEHYQLGDITWNYETKPVISGNRETRYMTIDKAYVKHQNGTTTTIADVARLTSSNNEIDEANSVMLYNVTISETDKILITKVTYDYDTGFNVSYFDTHTNVSILPSDNESDWASSDESVVKVDYSTTENAIVVTPDTLRRYQTATVSVQNKKTGAMGLFLVTVKYSDDTVASPMIAAGQDFSVALKSDGSVWTWGRNDKGQLGINNSAVAYRDYPVQVVNKDGDAIENIVFIAAGQFHAAAIDKDGNMYTWGYNEFGQIGNGESNDYSQVTGSVPYHSVGWYHSSRNCCKAPESTASSHSHDAEHTIYGYRKNDKNAYAAVSVFTNVMRASLGNNHSVAIRNDGSVWAWGDNYYNQAGLSQRADKSGYMGHWRYRLDYAANGGDNEYSRLAIVRTPMAVGGVAGIGSLEGFVDVKAGGDFTLALKKDGSAYVWGKNTEGQHGTGDRLVTYSTNEIWRHGNATVGIKFSYDESYKYYYPTQVFAGAQSLTARSTNTINASSTAYNYLQEITTISAGANHAAVITKNYDIYSWGDNEHYQLSDKTNEDRHLPVLAVKTISGTDEAVKAVQISSGANRTFIIATEAFATKNGYKDDRVLVWGDNTEAEYYTFSETVTTDQCDHGDHGIGRVTSARAWTRKWTLHDTNTVINALGIDDTTVVNQTEPELVVKGNTINTKYQDFSEYMRKYGQIETNGDHTVMFNAEDGTVWSWGSNGTLWKVGDNGIHVADTSYGVIGDFTENNRAYATQTGWIDYIRPYLTDFVKISRSDDTASATETTEVLDGKTNVIELTRRDRIEIDPAEIERLIKPGFNLHYTKEYHNDFTAFDAFFTRPAQLTVTILDENIAKFSTNAAGKYVIEPAESYTYGETNIMIRDNDSDIAFIFKVRTKMLEEEEKFGYDKKIAVPKIANGTSHAVALKTNGTVWTWGLNGSGQLGEGTKTNTNQPIQVLDTDGLAYLTDVIDVAAGTNFSVALRKGDGSTTYNSVYTWGVSNGSSLPVKVFEGSATGDILSISAADDMIYAIMNDAEKTVYAWKYGTTSITAASHLIKGESSASDGSGYFEGALDISGGINHAVILRDDGHVWTWSPVNSNSTNLGNTGRTYYSWPALVVSGESKYNSVWLNNVLDVQAGNNHNIAVQKDNSVGHAYDVPTAQAFTIANGEAYTWGSNAQGQLGVTLAGSATASSSPVLVTGVDTTSDKIEHVYAEGNTSTVQMKDRSVWAWGGDNDAVRAGSTTASVPTHVTDNASSVWTGAIGGAAGKTFAATCLRAIQTENLTVPYGLGAIIHTVSLATARPLRLSLQAPIR